MRFAARVFKINNCWQLGLGSHFGQTDSGSPTIFCDKLNPSLFESGPHIFKRTRIWLSCSAFKVCNRLRGSFACL